jgi:AmmeMemoRadiSam system protein B
MSRVRPPAVAGLFYTADAEVLRGEVETLVAACNRPEPPRRPKALIVPHAGFRYSGPVAGCAYRLLRDTAAAIDHVVLIGPCHRVPMRGLAVPSVEAFATPLGEVPINAAGCQRLRELGLVGVSDAPHASEHSLEVQLPFLQEVLGDFALVPFAVGDATPGEVAEVIELLWGGAETLFVVSSDLSHYHRYAEAREIDRATGEAILALSATLDHEQACGATPINGLLLAARRRGLQPELLDLRNSGDTAGDKSRVVGYASFAFTESEAA